MNLKSLKRALLAVLLIFLISSNSISFQVFSALGFSEPDRLRLKGKIGIFYDPYDVVVSQLANDLCLALDVANVSSSLYKVSSASKLDILLEESGVHIGIYFFQTNLDGIALGSEIVGWGNFAQILLKHEHVQHILGVGNTRALAEFIGENSGSIHFAEVDVVDAKLAFLYSLWEIAEVLKESKDGEFYKDVELDIRCVGLKFFADEFNDLFERTLEPKVPLGEEDVLEKQKRYERMIESFPYGVRELPPIPPDEETPNEIAKAELNKTLYANETTSDNQIVISGGATTSASQEHETADSAGGSRLYLTHMGDFDGIISVTGNPTTETLYKVMDLPLKSGLDGPIGEVVDLLLETILSDGKDSVAMAKSTVEEIFKVVKNINLIVGIAEGSGSASELKELFNLVKSEWPILDDYDVFFDLFVDSIYAFRTNNAGQIKNVVQDVLNAILDLTGSKNETASKVMNRLLDILFPPSNDLSQRLSGSERIFGTLLAYFNECLMSNITNRFPTASQIHATIENRMRRRAEADCTIESVMETILEGVAFAIVVHYNLNQTVYQAILEAMYPEDMGVAKPSSVKEAVDRVMRTLPVSLNETERAAIEAVLTASINIEGVFTDGYRWIFNQVSSWLSGEVEDLLNELTGGILQKIETFSFFHLAGDFPLGLGDWSAFQVSYDLALDAGINIRTEKLFEFVGDIIFDGLNWELGDTGDVFKRVLSFVEIVPTFKASIEVGGFGSERNSFMRMLLESLGVEISFEGGAHCNIELFRASISDSSFMRVVEWGFYFKVELSRDFTLLDFLTGGVGGSALNSLAEYIGLDSIEITVRFGVSVDIVKRAASPTGPEQGTFTLIIQIGAALRIGIDIIIASISFYGSLDVIFTFIQDLVGDAPLTIMMDLVAYIKVTIGFLFFDKSFSWGPKTIYHDQWPRSPGSKEDAENSGYAMGVDKDNDGLSDEYEERMNALGIVRLNSRNNDTDGDGLTDKEELQTAKTDPTNPDTDGDGLNDYEEYCVYKTNPRLPDTDFDGLTDYEEVKIYKTNPNVMDTDQDGLDDYFEVHHAWDISNCTTSVKEVWIGGVAYNDHTDPLNPDTDNDGLLDGEEGPSGGYYGLETPGVYNWTLANQGNISRRPIIFNYGYTHPLDNDTDDDSYLQWWNGTIALVGGEKRFLRSMTDGEEVKGIWVVIYDPVQDDWERKLIRTNPCNPDTDGDTGPDYPQHGPVDPSRYIMSDGYELSFNPPTDPTNGDSDHDGILDGLEGVLNPDSYHTNPMNPDTDGDGLGDLQEILLGTNPRNSDTDHDGVLDGDECCRFHTNPLISDSDFDGLTDGEEVYFWHTNPLLRDSDGDGISDGLEVLKYDTDPLDEDTDNDGINDYDEIFKYRTNPFDPDTDGDGLRDGEEAYIYLCDPLNWDTDGDSITYPNEYGQMTWPMSDGDEVIKFHTSPVRADTDGDGLSDALELYLGSGRIPRNVLEPIPLNAVNADTDGDGLFDGEELRVGNTSSIIYPYIALMPYSFYNTSALNPDSDGDGLSDFEEVNGVLYDYHSFEQGIAKFNYTGSMPHIWDSDGDGLSDGDEVFYHGTDPCKADTDGDGIIDAYETTLYDTAIARTSGVFYSRQETAPGAPNASFTFSPIRQTASRETLVRIPYVTFNASTSVDLNGTIAQYSWDFGDGAKITKLASEANPTIVTHSYLAYGNYTVSLTVTDNDGLNSTVKANVIIRISTSALNSDSDKDKAPDGYETSEIRVTTYNSSYTEVYTITPVENITMILHYPITAKYGVTEVKPATDPLDPDSNDNRVLDGDEFDLDHDGITDGDEFYTDKTWQGMFYKPDGSFVIGGFLCADSDGDGLSDGFEKKIGTSPINRDTDGDGYSDGAEVALGTDPLTPTSPEEYQQALERFRAGKIIRIISPLNATTIDVTVSVRVLNSTFVQNMWFRYDDGTGWSQNFTLEYDPLEEQWKNTTMIWDYKSYHLEVYGELANGSVVRDEVWFTVTAPPPPETPPIYLWLVAGLVIGAGATSTSMLFFFRRKARATSKSKNEETSGEEKEDKK